MSKEELLKSAEIIKLMQSKFPGFQAGSFRNDLHAKNIKIAKKVKNGKMNTLFFTKAELDAYAKKYADRISRNRAGYSNEQSSKRGNSLLVNVGAEKLNTLLEVFSKEQLEQKLKAVLDEIHAKVQMELQEIDKKKKALLDKIKL